MKKNNKRKNIDINNNNEKVQTFTNWKNNIFEKLPTDVLLFNKIMDTLFNVVFNDWLALLFIKYGDDQYLFEAFYGEENEIVDECKIYKKNGKVPFYQEYKPNANDDNYLHKYVYHDGDHTTNSKRFREELWDVFTSNEEVCRILGYNGVYTKDNFVGKCFICNGDFDIDKMVICITCGKKVCKDHSADFDIQSPKLYSTVQTILCHDCYHNTLIETEEDENPPSSFCHKFVLFQPNDDHYQYFMSFYGENGTYPIQQLYHITFDQFVQNCKDYQNQYYQSYPSNYLNWSEFASIERELIRDQILASLGYEPFGYVVSPEHKWILIEHLERKYDKIIHDTTSSIDDDPKDEMVESPHKKSKK